jgi:hypothetical protein
VRLWFVVAFAGCGFSTPLENPAVDGAIADAPPIDARPIDGAPGSARKRRITIPDAKVFASVADFPVWLVIDDPPGLGAKATANGADIYFTRLDGTPLEHQRIAWDKATGHLEAWVKVSLTDGGPNELEMRFGDPGPAHAPNAPAVWTNNFVAVWHMDDALANTTVADARGAVNGTAVNGPVSVPGKLGKAIDFDGMNDEVTFTSPVAGDGSTTFSAWVSIAQPLMGFSSVLTVGNPATNQSRFLHTDFGGIARGFYGNDVQLDIDIHNSTFTLLHWVYDNGANTSTLYRDGVMIGSVATVSGTINTLGTAGHIGTAPVQWGPGGNTPNPINGLMDEVRIAATARSAGWIRTEWENQRDALAFYTLGDDLPAQ